MSEIPPPLPARRRVPVVGLLLGAWVVVYLLMMWHGGWRWNTGGFFGFGTPPRSTLRQFGLLVPSELRWQALWLSPLLHRSLLGLVFLVFFWRSTGRAIVSLLGPSWTFVTFVVGGFAAAAAHLATFADSPALAGVGPFDPILCAVGLQLGWGLGHRDARGLIKKALWTLVMICLWIGLGMWLSEIRDFTDPAIREAVGLDAMLGALVGGVLLAFAIGLARGVAPRPSVWLGRGLAGVLALGLLGAVATQAGPLLRSAERQEAQAFLQQLRRVERAVDKLLDQREASTAKRDRLAQEHARLLSHAFLEDYEGKETLLRYAKALKLYTQPIDTPFLTEPLLRKRFKEWHSNYEAPLRKEFALSRRGSPWSDQ